MLACCWVESRALVLLTAHCGTGLTAVRTLAVGSRLGWSQSCAWTAGASRPRSREMPPSASEMYSFLCGRNMLYIGTESYIMPVYEEAVLQLVADDLLA